MTGPDHERLMALRGYILKAHIEAAERRSTDKDWIRGERQVVADAASCYLYGFKEMEPLRDAIAAAREAAK